MKVFVGFSGGKDSQASLIHSVKKWGAKNVVAVFCDTRWEHALLYPFVKEVCAKLGVELIILKSELGFLELAIKENRFPSTKAKFCTGKLKMEPMIDFIIDQLANHDYMIVVQGIRAQESNARAKMQPHCQYFKYYFEPYGHDKQGKPKYYSYRKKDIIKYEGKGLSRVSKVDIDRPVFDWSAAEVINYILEHDQKPNPLYYMGFERVGCMPCIMATHWEVWLMITKLPEYAERLLNAEIECGRSFFPPTYIPKRYHDKQAVTPTGIKTFASAKRVFEYITQKNAQGQLHPEEGAGKNCMTAFNICE